MDRARAAEGDQGETAGIAASLDRHDARGQLHVGVDDGVNAPRRVLERQVERPRDLLLDHARRRAALQPHRAAGEVVRIDVAEDDVGVRHRRLDAASPVADGARRRRGTLRADRDDAEPGVRDRPAARADLDEIDRLDVHRQPAAGRGRRGGPPLLDQRELRGGPAHVEGDEVTVSGELAVGRRHQRAGGGAGLDHPDGMPLHGLGGRHAPGGLHHEQPPAVAAAGGRGGEAAQIFPDGRHDIGVHDGRRRALVFAKGRRHLVGQRHRDVRRFLGDQLRQPPLVNGIQI